MENLDIVLTKPHESKTWKLPKFANFIAYQSQRRGYFIEI